jgi:hypothetical protein
MRAKPLKSLYTPGTNSDRIRPYGNTEWETEFSKIRRIRFDFLLLRLAVLAGFGFVTISRSDGRRPPLQARSLSRPLACLACPPWRAHTFGVPQGTRRNSKWKPLVGAVHPNGLGD